MSATELLLIDLSGIAHMLFHVSGNEPDPSFISTQIIARVRALASAHPFAAICCDSGKSFRADIDPTYKANRDTENRAPLRHQMDVACETLKRDGFPVWRVPGMEADDIIASAVKQATAIDGTTVQIVSSDKDLLQLVSDRVRVRSLVTGNVSGPPEVLDKFGVRPEQMGDLLALMGDKSDNIKGAEKIGQVIGARLLSEHGTLQALYDKMALGVVSGVTPTMRTNLMEFRNRWPTVAQLIALRTDVEIPFHEIATERSAAPMVEEAEMVNLADVAEFVSAGNGNRESMVDDARELSPAAATDALSEATAKVAERIAQNGTATNGLGQPVDVSAMRPVNAQSSQVVPYVATPVDFSQQLEPRNLDEAAKLAGHMFKARLFNAYGTWEGVFSTILAGRELGLPAMASLRAFHIIESRPQLSADTIAALVLKSGKAKYFKCTGRSATAASFKTLRFGEDEEPFEFVYTIEEARKAWKKDEKAWNGSSWGTNPADMLIARAKSKLARLVYPDVVGGLYSVEEVD